MPVDIATLAIRVQSLEVAQADKRLDGLNRTGRQTEGVAKTATDSWGLFAVKAAAVAAAAYAARRSIGDLRAYQDLSAALKTATGDADTAAATMAQLEALAATMPDNVADVTTAFIRMTNLGLNPSEAALISYSNTASALGKDLMQFVEAVADASVGEFERLKEFGIKASNEGEQIAFRFRGQTLRVKNDAASITEYLERIGTVEFAGAAAERASMLTGAISNAEAAVSRFFRSLSDNEAIGGTFAAMLRGATESLNNWADTINPPKVTELQQSIAGATGELMRLRGELDAAQQTEGVAGFLNRYLGASPEQIQAEIDTVRASIAAWQAELMAMSETGGALGSGVVPPEEQLAADAERLQAALDLAAHLRRQADAQRQLDNQAHLDALAAQQAAADADAEARALASAQMQISMASVVHNALTGLMAATNTKGKALQIAMLIAQQLIAFKQSIINTQVAVTRALSIDPTGVLAARVQTMGNAATAIIAATSVAKLANATSGGGDAGNFVAGGDIPAGMQGTAGEAGAEIVTRPTTITGPAHVTSARDTAAMLGSSVSFGDIYFNIQAIDSESSAQWIARHGDDFFSTIRERMNEAALSFVHN